MKPDVKLSGSVEIQFDVPWGIVGGMIKGDLIRRGGVIQKKSGEIVAWLREVSIRPVEPDVLGASMGDSRLANAFGFIGNVSSILNLGATVAFGSATLRKLSEIHSNIASVGNQVASVDTKINSIGTQITSINEKIDSHIGVTVTLGLATLEKLVDIDSKIATLQWTVDLGFAHILKHVDERVDEIKRCLEASIAAKLRSAAQLAWSAQSLEPKNYQRTYRIENALSCATEAVEQILPLAEQGCKSLADSLTNTASYQQAYPYNYNNNPDAIRIQLQHNTITGISKAIEPFQRIRLALFATSLQALLLAESGQPDLAASFLDNTRNRVIDACRSFILPLLKINGAYNQFPALLQSVKPNQLPIIRIGRWISTFDPEYYGTPESATMKVIEGLRERGMLITQSQAWPTDDTYKFASLIDGVIEDLDRQAGTIQELIYCDHNKLTWQEYRDIFKIDDAPEGKKIAFLFMKEKTGMEKNEKKE